MKMLARAPDVQKRLKKELTDAGLLEREMTYHDLLADKVPCESHNLLTHPGSR
jgi:hypothetical protein